MYRKLSYLLLFTIFIFLTWSFLTFAENIGYKKNTPYYFIPLPILSIILTMKTTSLLLIKNLAHIRLIVFYNYIQVLIVSLFWFLFNVWLIGYDLNLGFGDEKTINLLVISIIYSLTTFVISFTSLRTISLFKSK